MSFSRIFTLCAICTFSALVQAESENKVVFNVATEAGYIDNFLYLARDEQSTAYYNLSSDLAFTTKSQQSAVTVDAKVTSNFFQNFDSDNHTNFTLIPKYQFKFSQNQRLYISSLWLTNYAYRGLGISTGDAESLSKGDEQESIAAAIGYEYGTFESQGKLNFELTYNESQFTTRRNLTRSLDTEIVNFKSSFDYLLSGKTFLAFDLDYKITEYPNDPLNNRDSITGLAGVKWYTTVISEFNFLVGFQQLNFSDSRLSNEEAFKWRFDYTWRPSDHTKLHFVSNRKFDESYRLISSYRLADTYQIDLEHAFTETLDLFVSVGLNHEKFITEQRTQEEDYLFTELTLNYQYSARLSVQLNYQYKSLGANVDDIDYLYNSVGLKLKISL